MNWDSLVGLLAMLVAYKTLPFDKHPLRPWNGVGSAAFVRYVNPTDTIQTMIFVAPKFDETPRARSVEPGEQFVKMPYDDTVVLVIVGHDTTRLRPMQPGIYNLSKEKWQ